VFINSSNPKDMYLLILANLILLVLPIPVKVSAVKPISLAAKSIHAELAQLSEKNAKPSINSQMLPSPMPNLFPVPIK